MDNSYSFTFTTTKPHQEIFDMLLDVRNWWSGLYNEIIEGNSHITGEEFSYSAGNGAHASRHKLVEMVPCSRMAWLTTDSSLSFLEQKDEWTGTTISFDLVPDDNTTQITFTHHGLVPQIACYGQCMGAWQQYMNKLAAAVK